MHALRSSPADATACFAATHIFRRARRSPMRTSEGTGFKKPRATTRLQQNAPGCSQTRLHHDEGIQTLPRKRKTLSPAKVLHAPTSCSRSAREREGMYRSARERKATQHMCQNRAANLGFPEIGPKTPLFRKIAPKTKRFRKTAPDSVFFRTCTIFLEIRPKTAHFSESGPQKTPF